MITFRQPPKLFPLEDLLTHNERLRTFMEKNTGRFDWGCQAATREFVVTVMRAKFGFTNYELPSNHLIPSVTRSLNYLDFIDHLLTSVGIPPNRLENVVLVDVGTGASVVFPLLASHRHPSWKCIAMENDAESITAARENVKRCRMEKSVEIVEINDVEPRFVRRLREIAKLPPPHETSSLENDESNPLIGITMSNPPFFEDAEEETDGDSLKSSEHQRQWSGNALQRVYSRGGEVEFVKTMMEESRRATHNFLWYTTMIGRRSSLAPLLDFLRSSSSSQRLDERDVDLTVNTRPTAVKVAMLQQGKITRWVIAWSFVVREKTSGLRLEFKVTNLGSAVDEEEEGEKTSSDEAMDDEAHLRLLMRRRIEKALSTSTDARPLERNDEEGATTFVEQLPNSYRAIVRMTGFPPTVSVEMENVADFERRTAEAHMHRIAGDIRRENRKWRRKVTISHPSNVAKRVKSSDVD